MRNSCNETRQISLSIFFGLQTYMAPGLLRQRAFSISKQQKRNKSFMSFFLIKYFIGIQRTEHFFFTTYHHLFFCNISVTTHPTFLFFSRIFLKHFPMTTFLGTAELYTGGLKSTKKVSNECLWERAIQILIGVEMQKRK